MPRCVRSLRGHNAHMTTRTATANGLSKQDANYLTRIDRCLGDMRSIHQDIVRKRTQGRKVKARIDRNLKEIQAVIDRVEGPDFVERS